MITTDLLLKIYSKINNICKDLSNDKRVRVPLITPTFDNNSLDTFLEDYGFNIIYKIADSYFIAEGAMNSKMYELIFGLSMYTDNSDKYKLTEHIYRNAASEFYNPERIERILKRDPISEGNWPQIPLRFNTKIINVKIFKTILYLYLKIPPESLLKYLYVKYSFVNDTIFLTETELLEHFDVYLNNTLFNLNLNIDDSNDSVLFNEMVEIESTFQKMSLNEMLYKPALYHIK